MIHVRILLSVSLTAVVAVWLGAIHSELPTSRAIQVPRLSLDMQPAGNTYDDVTNTMTVGAIDDCLTSEAGNNAQHSHPAHILIQDVEDLVGWQARMNYDGGRMRPFTVNFTPFTDNNTGQNVSFLNPIWASRGGGLAL